jgi:hypothetical protein
VTLTGAGLVGGFGGTATAAGWTRVPSETDNTLYGVAYTSNGAYAVGGGGDVLERTADGWKKILDGGPTGNGNDLYGAGVTDDGERLWFVGSSGAIGEYDVSTGSLNDHSQPNDVSNNFNDVAVTGPAGDANVYVAGDSGHIYYSFENGETGTWDNVTPGSGSAINAIDFYDNRAGHAVDGNQTAFATDDGTTYDKIGISDANVNLYGVDSDAADTVWVSGGGGTVFEYDGADWETTDLGDAGLRDIAIQSGSGYTVGGGGKVFQRSNGAWHQESTPTGANLKAVVRGAPDVTVGASGTVLEK